MPDFLAGAGRATARTLRAFCSPGGLCGAGLELAWSATHLALYPLGVSEERARRHHDEHDSLQGLRPLERGRLLSDVEAAGTPILLVHGLVDNRSIFTLLRRSLRRRGFGRVTTLNYSVFTQDIPAAARRLAERVEQLCAETGYERVHVVGHSLGGVIARYYVQRLGGDARVHTLATLGSPHSGTHAAWLLPRQIVRQLRPGSPVMRELAAPAPDCRTRFLAVYSDIDHLMLPTRVARVDHPDLRARNVLLHGVGHMSLPVDPRVVREIVNAFAHLDEEGETVVRGVTSISSEPGSPVEAVAPSAREVVPVAVGAAGDGAAVDAGSAG